MLFLEASRYRRFLVLTLLSSSILVILYNIFWKHVMDTELPLKKFILEEKDVPVIQRIIQNYSLTQSQSKSPLLVLFTTMQMTPGKEPLYENTLRLWPQLKPAVLPVLLISDLSTKWQQKARNYGWDIMQLKHTFGNLPIIKHMWLNVMEKYNGSFYAYANADVLFDESLVLTLQMLHDANFIKKSPFIIGRRTNYFVNPKEKFHDLKDLRIAMSKPSAELFIMDAQDYFITTRNGFPWSRIPDFVIARVGYDNWLVSYALSQYHFVIDATSTVTCLHQSDSDGNKAGFSHKYLFDVNKQLAGPGFDFHLGKTDCAKVETISIQNRLTSIAKDGTKGISLIVRSPSNYCKYWFEKKGVDVNRI